MLFSMERLSLSTILPLIAASRYIYCVNLISVTVYACLYYGKTTANL